jgi:hypothetical protein
MAQLPFASANDFMRERQLYPPLALLSANSLPSTLQGMRGRQRLVRFNRGAHISFQTFFMRERIQKLFGWVYDHDTYADDGPCPVYRTTDGSARMCLNPRTGSIEWTYAEFAPSIVTTIQEQWLRVVIRKEVPDDAWNRLVGPHFYLDFQFRDVSDGEWKPLVLMHEHEFGTVLDALHRVKRFLHSDERPKRASANEHDT